MDNIFFILKFDKLVLSTTVEIYKILIWRNKRGWFLQQIFYNFIASRDLIQLTHVSLYRRAFSIYNHWRKLSLCWIKHLTCKYSSPYSQILVLEGNELWVSTLDSFTTVGLETPPPNHCSGELCGAQSRSGRVVREKNSWFLPRIKPRFLGSPAAAWNLSTHNVRETPVFARTEDFHAQEHCNSNKMTCCCYWLSWRSVNTSG